MFENIVEAIICSEFDQRFKRMMTKNSAMLIRFSLTCNYDIEDGYRNLQILIYGGGSNYIGVYAKADWTVAQNDWFQKNGECLITGKNYINGETPFVLYGYHDSCWRAAVHSILSEYRERITSIDWVFGGWYKVTQITEIDERELYEIRRNTPGYGGKGDRLKVSELEFKFPVDIVCTGEV